MTEEIKTTPIAEYLQQEQKKLATACTLNGTPQTTKPDASSRRQRTTVKRQNSKEMAGEHNRPLDLLLGR